LLQKLLSEYRYPKKVEGYWSPLSYAFTHKVDMAIRIICDHLMEAEYEFEINKVDLSFLLESNNPYCHDLLSKIPQKLTKKKFPSHVITKKEREMYREANLSEVILKIKAEEDLVHREESKRAKQYALKKKKTPNPKKGKVVDAYHFNLEYSYETGSIDSLKFLDNYSNSNSEQFVVGLWGEVIAEKWSHFYWVNVLNFFLYWAFTGIITMLMIFWPNHKTLLIVYYVFNILYIIYELIQVISYSYYHFKR
jgi:hypothetical protein